MLDPHVRRRHRLRNAVQGFLLLGGMVAVLAALAWLLFGLVGLFAVAVVAAIVLATRPAVPAHWVLGMYGARPVPPAAAPELHRYVRILAERAGLAVPPTLYYVASPMVNAFAVGRRDDSALAVTDGLLRRLTSRELVGVLAHEIGHIRSDDLWIMNLSDSLGRLTHGLAYAGLFLLVIAVPLSINGTYAPLWIAVLLTVVPTVVTLLQLALSRSREYDADLHAAELTGDPEGLASALEALERCEGRLWERVMVPRRRAPDPLLLRTHPPTADRTRRLRELVVSGPHARLGDHREVPRTAYPHVQAPTRLRFPGVRW
ncbi:MAG: zinc metalloprotease HtpX [Pseudonocardia sp.]